MGDADLTRRAFLEAVSRWGLVLGGTGLIVSSPSLQRLLELDELDPDAAEALSDLIRRAPVARYWTSTTQKDAACAACHTASELKSGAKPKHKSATVKCLLCAHTCVIPAGERGRCRTRFNLKGELKSLVYGRPITEHVDPIEKKPFYHFLPGSQAYSLATAGCPLHCKFCQNWTISQARPEDHSAKNCPPGEMADRARWGKVPILAFTYNEPTVFTEYLTDIAREGKKAQIKSVIVSCGFMNEAPLQEMIEVLDGIKIDLKGFSPQFYRQVTDSELAPVLRSIKQVAKAGRHLEIVNLVVPTLNDSETMLTQLAKWVVGEAGPDVPVHFTRFHPDYQLQNLPPTPIATLERAREIGMKQGLRYAYVGNVPGHPGNHTYCPKCGKAVIERTGFFTTGIKMKDGKCEACAAPIPGVWK
jgi:pyruvate formate lyase activating enzyme